MATRKRTAAGGPAEAARVDGLYRPFVPFADWGRLGGVRRDLWARFAAALAQRRQLARPDLLERAVAVALRSAALDTGAIEGLYQVDRGFTWSVAVQSFAWELALAERGDSVPQLFAAQLAGYELVIGLVGGRAPLGEAWLRSLHERICAPQATYRVLTAQGWQQQTLPLGLYKAVANQVRLADGTVHAYAPVADVAAEMHRLVEQLRSPAFENAHPVEQAAYAHHAFTAVHPFADGNGRVARALASVYLYRSLGIPFVVFAHQRSPYFDALEHLDRGDADPWLSFVADRGIDTMQLVLESLQAAAAPRPDEIAEPMAADDGARGRTDAEWDNLALHLLVGLQDRWVRAIAPLLAGAAIERGPGDWRPPAGYRRIDSPRFPVLTLALRAPAPVAFTRMISLRVNVALDDANPFAFQLEACGSDDRLDVRDADVAPDVSDSLLFRIDLWTERQLATMMAERARQVAGAPA